MLRVDAITSTWRRITGQGIEHGRHRQPHARPITLGDLFTDEIGVDRLSVQAKRSRPAGADPRVTRPIRQNFANWIPSAKGMEVHWGDDQRAHPALLLAVAEFADIGAILGADDADSEGAALSV